MYLCFANSIYCKEMVATRYEKCDEHQNKDFVQVIITISRLKKNIVGWLIPANLTLDITLTTKYRRNYLWDNSKIKYKTCTKKISLWHKSLFIELAHLIRHRHILQTWTWQRWSLHPELKQHIECTNAILSPTIFIT